VYYSNSQQTRSQEATQQFSRALLDYHSGNTQLTIMSLGQILEDFPGTKVADQSTFLLAKVNYESQNYPEALRYYQMYIDQFKESKFRRASAVAGIAACMENQGDFAGAARQFEVAIDEYPDGPLVADHHFSAMRNYLEVGEIESARTHLDAISEDFEGSNFERKALRIFTEKSKS
jgi:TolA-binding protein